jgi:archaemetzincin
MSRSRLAGRLPLLVAALIAASGCATRGETVLRLAIQPFGSLEQDVIERVRRGVTGAYRLEITILPPAELPAAAYYRPNARYRAEKLLAYLGSERYGSYDKVLGLTDRDISTTKGNIDDWGIFGLGSMGGKACVVSTFRLGRGASRGLFYRRLVKVVNHELGHTFGLPHCPVDRCLMGDAQGTIVTVDRETGALCGQCKEKMRALNVCRSCGG